MAAFRAIPAASFLFVALPVTVAAADGPITVKFRSAPDGALVVVDGKDRCTAPCQMDLLAGTHVVGMSHDGYLAREEIVAIGAGSTLDVQTAPE